MAWRVCEPLYPTPSPSADIEFAPKVLTGVRKTPLRQVTGSIPEQGDFASAVPGEMASMASVRRIDRSHFT